MTWAGFLDESQQPKWATAMEARLNRKMDIIMGMVQVEQGDLDALDVSLDEIATAFENKIQALIDAAQTPLPEAELSALQADVVALRGLSAPVPPPA